MTILDQLRRIHQELQAIGDTDSDVLRAQLAEGYSIEPPKNYAKLTPEEWAASDLYWLTTQCEWLAKKLNPNPGELVSRVHGGPLTIEYGERSVPADE